MKTLSLFILLTSLAQATEYVKKEIDFTYVGNNGSSSTYYSCDYARDQLERHLQSLGAQKIDVSCSGGLDRWMTMPVSLYGSIEVPTGLTAENARATTKILKPASAFDTACDFNVKLLDTIIPLFDNVTLVNKRGVCFNNRSRWSYELTLFE